MGADASRDKAQKIVNQTARTIFLDFLEIIKAQPPEIQNSSKFKKMAYCFYHSCKNQPEGTTHLSIVLTGKDIGPQFINVGINFLRTYSMITKISFRGSSLTKDEAIKFSRYIKTSSSVKEVDLSENKLRDEGVKAILDACVGHPRLEALILESTGSTDSVSSNIITLISNSNLKILRLSPIQLEKASLDNINTAIVKNVNLTVFTISDHNAQPEVIKRTLYRNSDIQNIVSEIIAAPFYRAFKVRNDVYKSVKGRRIIEGRVLQSKIRSESLFAAEKSAQNAACHHITSTRKMRIGTSETIGVRESMEDFMLIKQGFLEAGNVLIGIFDGHGGREASEYAGNSISSVLSGQMKSASEINAAIEASFAQINSAIRSSNQYAGTTACIGVVNLSKSEITVANVGDTRCILIRKNAEVDKIQHLSVDHKPDMPHEKEFIQKNGGFVENGRVNGILAVSRSLGDGCFGDVINPIPHITTIGIAEDEEYILIFGCDGLWDVISEQQAADIVIPEIDPMLAARKLRDAALNNGSTDNISVVVAFISQNESE